MLACLTLAPASAQNLNGDTLRWDPSFGLYNAPTTGGTVVWPPGTYDLGADTGTASVPPPDGLIPHAFVLEPTQTAFERRPRTDLTIDATGVTIVVKDPFIRVFGLSECHGIVIRGLTVTYDPLPFNQSSVTAVNLATGTFDVTLEPGYLGFESPFFGYGTSQPLGSNNWGALFDPATSLLKARTASNFMILDGFQQLGGSSYRLTVNPQYLAYLNDFAVGDRFVYVMRRNYAHIFRIGNCNATATRPPATVENIHADSSPGSPFVLVETPAVSSGQAIIRNCTVTPRGDQDLVSTDAGAVYVQNCRMGPVIHNCTFERVMDDAIACYTVGRYFDQYPNPGDFTVVDVHGGTPFAAGDLLQVYDPSTGTVSYPFIVSVTGGSTPYDPKQLVLSMPVPGMAWYGADPQRSTLLFNLNAANPWYHIHDNTIRDNRSFGVDICSVVGIFENNTIDGSSQRGINLANVYVACCLTGPVPVGATVRNNLIRNCGYDFPISTTGRNASVFIGGMKSWPLANVPADVQSAGNFEIEGNTIENWTEAGFYAVSVRDSVFRPLNGFYNTFRGPTLNADRAIVIADPAGNISIEGVDTTQSTGLDFAVTIENGVDPSVSVIDGTIAVTAPTQELQDLR